MANINVQRVEAKVSNGRVLETFDGEKWIERVNGVSVPRDTVIVYIFQCDSHELDLFDTRVLENRFSGAAHIEAIGIVAPDGEWDRI